MHIMRHTSPLSMVWHVSRVCVQATETEIGAAVWIHAAWERLYVVLV